MDTLGKIGKKILNILNIEEHGANTNLLSLQKEKKVTIDNYSIKTVIEDFPSFISL